MHPGHAITGLEPGDARPGLAHDAGAFVAQGNWQRLFVQTAAKLRIEEIDAGRLNFNQQVFGLQRLQRKLVEAQTFRSTVLVDPDNRIGCH